jgi:hypothetical protein
VLSSFPPSRVGFPLTPLAELKWAKRGERGMGVKREREGWGGWVGGGRERERDATLRGSETQRREIP